MILQKSVGTVIVLTGELYKDTKMSCLPVFISTLYVTGSPVAAEWRVQDGSGLLPASEQQQL